HFSITATTLLYTLSLRDALPIFHRGDSETVFPSNPCSREELAAALPIWKRFIDLAVVTLLFPFWLPVMTLVALWVAVTSPGPIRSEEHTSELQSRFDLVCRLLLE